MTIFKIPKPAWFHKIGVHGEHRFYDSTETQPEGCAPLYTAQALKDALEQAAQVCESEYDNWDNERPLRICATEIRKMIGEIK